MEFRIAYNRTEWEYSVACNKYLYANLPNKHCLLMIEDLEDVGRRVEAGCGSH